MGNNILKETFDKKYFPMFTSRYSYGIKMHCGRSFIQRCFPIKTLNYILRYNLITTQRFSTLKPTKQRSNKNNNSNKKTEKKTTQTNNKTWNSRRFFFHFIFVGEVSENSTKRKMIEMNVMLLYATYVRNINIFIIKYC